MNSAKSASTPKESDDVNWFGVKVGTESSIFGKGNTAAGVGKYLDLKRPREATVSVADVDDGKKKRKIGFGNFEGW